MLPLFLLADSRLPSGGHGHSGGVEALVDRGLLRTAEDLALFLEGRVRTGGRVVAAAAAAACALAGGSRGLQQGGHTATDGAGPPCCHPGRARPEPRRTGRAWDAAVSARTPSAALRAASRAQGAALLRTVSLAFPTPAVAALRALPRVHHPLVLGAAAAAAGGRPGRRRRPSRCTTSSAGPPRRRSGCWGSTRCGSPPSPPPWRGPPSPWPPTRPRWAAPPSPRATRHCCRPRAAP